MTCVEWPGLRYPNGYGCLAVYHDGTASRFMAHRIEYERYHGEIPAGLTIHHLCENKGCVNPEHLAPMTQQENLARSVHPKTRRTHCPRGHAYDQVRWECGREVRRCSTCRKEQQENRKRRKSLLRG